MHSMKCPEHIKDIYWNFWAVFTPCSYLAPSWPLYLQFTVSYRENMVALRCEMHSKLRKRNQMHHLLKYLIEIKYINRKMWQKDTKHSGSWIKQHNTKQNRSALGTQEHEGTADKLTETQKPIVPGHA